MLILMTGRAGAGKDTVADVFSREYGFSQCSFARALREEVQECVLTNVWPATPPHIDVAGVTCGEVWEKPTTPRMRRLLQWYGTEYRRNQFGKDYWVRAFERWYNANTSGRGDYVITDCRFPNEAVWGLQNDAWVIRVTRPGLPAAPSHASELVERLPYHDELMNDGSLSTLRTRARLLVPRLRLREHAAAVVMA